MFSAIYASPRYAKRQFLQDNLSSIANLHSLPWAIVGDFNEILMSDDKFGGRTVNINRALRFQDCLDNCKMLDIEFTGPRFTQSNRRPMTQLIQERIDRVFINTGGMCCFLKRLLEIQREFIQTTVQLCSLWLASLVSDSQDFLDFNPCDFPTQISQGLCTASNLRPFLYHQPLLGLKLVQRIGTRSILVTFCTGRIKFEPDLEVFKHHLQTSQITSQ